MAKNEIDTDDIRHRVMEAPSSDIRDEVADLCKIVGNLVSRLEKAERDAQEARNMANAMADGMRPIP